MNDWLGLLFFILLIAGIYIGLKILSKPRSKTEADFERGAAEGSGTLNAGFNALNELLNPNEGKAKEVKIQLKEGRFNKKKREGKANGEDLSEENND